MIKYLFNLKNGNLTYMFGNHFNNETLKNMFLKHAVSEILKPITALGCCVRTRHILILCFQI